MSGFPIEYVAAYLFANKLAKDGPVALIETHVLMLRVSSARHVSYYQ